ncbi:helix-turn-helix domain-containing protein [Grimontia sp. NTOU-MAR1]|uniref:helix-turn-helix domain-containing protein n=1 Tax=Grimontia sp. NTOU-MAR1 TaxID=3111011 RepID=UPI002DBE8767|nr:helix-turn-helix domain-containing protein [Grimontia sp. NTOU-MAR1]WRV97635.1 helix-turn-helix domain-containing protein [Grimontia sp. NTOU-MAR1]
MSLLYYLLAKYRLFPLVILTFIGQSVAVQASPIFYTFPFPSASDTSKIKEIEYADRRGVWLLDTNGRVSYYDGVHYHKLDAFTPIGQDVSHIELFNRDLWLVSKGQLLQYDISNNRLAPFNLKGKVTEIIGTPDHLWVNTVTHTYLIDKKALQTQTYSDVPFSGIFELGERAVAQDGDKVFALPSGSLIFELSTELSAIEEINDQYWAGTEQGIFVFEEGNGQRRYLSNIRIDHLAVTAEGVWAGTPSGLFLKKAEDEEFVLLSGQSDDAFSFSGHAIRDLQLGVMEELWVATDVGLNYRSTVATHIDRFPMYILSPEPGEEQLSALVPHGNDYLLSTRYKLVALDDKLNPIKSTQFDSAIDSMIMFDGILWVASASGLKAYDPETFSLLEGKVPKAIEDTPVNRIISDSHSLWLAEGANIMRFWPKGQTVVDFGSDWSGSFNNRLTSVIDLEESGTWLGTINGLYFYFDGRFIPKLTREQVGAIKSLKVGPDGEVWMLTQRGVYTYDAVKQALPQERFVNTPDDIAKCLVVNGASSLYVTSKGIYRHQFSNQALQFVQGAPNSVPSLRHYCQKNEEKMLIAGDFGVFSIPEPTLAFLFNAPPAPVSPSAIYVNGIPWRLGPSSDEPLSISTRGTVAIEVGQMPFATTDKVEYRLEGNGDDSWYTTNDQKLVFSALNTGKYTLVLKLRKGSGPSQEVSVISFVIEPPWHERIGYFLFVLCVVIICTALYYRKKNTAIRAQNKQLRETVHRKVIEIDKREASTKRFCNGSRDSLSVFESGSVEIPHSMTTDSVSNSVDKEAEDWHERILSEIGNHFHDPEYSTALLAKALFTSERSLQRRFKLELGSTFKEVLITTRLENAKRMLCQGDKITDVAVACGFNEPSYFTKSFKLKYGVTPSQFRDTCGSEQHA